jgi:outer membrane protein with glycine zipper
MRRLILALTFAAAVGTVACDRGANRAADSALNTDLSLAAQQKGFQPLDSVTAAERAPGSTATRTRLSGGDVARRRTTSSGTTTSRSSEGTVVVKHPQRDAAIGAAAGAVIGATTSRNKVKGGLIGAAIGGILGGVIGNNVDKQKKKP